MPHAEITRERVRLLKDSLLNEIDYHFVPESACAVATEGWIVELANMAYEWTRKEEERS